MFSETVQKLSAGAIDGEASMRLKELIDKCMTSGMKGSISLCITVAPDHKTGKIVTLIPEIKVSLPKPRPPQSHFLVRPNGDMLALDDDLQTQFEFNPVAAPIMIDATTQPKPEQTFRPIEEIHG